MEIPSSSPSPARPFARPGVTLRRVAIAACAALWAIGVAGGFVAVARYSMTPGAAADAPARWPAASKLTRDSSRGTLVVLAHPFCPCTRATLAELERVMSHAGGQCDAHVLFVDAGAGEQDVRGSASWQIAARIPGVEVHVDDAGAEARRFGARTSGQAVLYDAAGRLVFHGGLTPSRGHQGDNVGSDAVLAWLETRGSEAEGRTLRGASEGTVASVYGCSLFDKETP